MLQGLILLLKCLSRKINKFMLLYKLLLLLSMSLIPLLICAVIKTELERLQLSGTKIVVPTADSQETQLNTQAFLWFLW